MSRTDTLDLQLLAAAVQAKFSTLPCAVGLVSSTHDYCNDASVISLQISTSSGLHEVTVRGRFCNLTEATAALLSKVDEAMPQLVSQTLDERTHRRVLDV